MAKGVQFNKGILDIKPTNVTWKIPTSEVHCVSINELDYLRETENFAAPLSNIEHIDEQLQFSWTLPEGYKPIESVSKDSAWYKLKTAKNFLEIAKLFKESKDLKTVFESINFYVDKYYNVKVLFYTHSLHLPHQSNENEDLQRIKKILAGLFTSVNDKKLDTYNLKDSSGKEKKSSFIEKIFQSDSIEELIQVIDIEYNHYLALQDQRQAIQDTNKRKKQNKSLMVFSGLIVVILVAWYFTNGTDDSEIRELEAEATEKQEELEEVNKSYENQLASYDAYFDGDYENALKAAENVNDNPNGLNEVFYIELLVRNGKINEAVEQFPERVNYTAEKFAQLGEKEAVLEMDLDNPYFKFEQALLKEDEKDEELAGIIPELKNPTVRQKQLIFEFYLRTDRAEALAYAQDHKNISWEIKVLESQKKSLEKKVEKLDKKDDKKEIKKVEKEIKEVSKDIESLKEKL